MWVDSNRLDSPESLRGIWLHHKSWSSSLSWFSDPQSGRGLAYSGLAYSRTGRPARQALEGTAPTRTRSSSCHQKLKCHVRKLKGKPFRIKDDQFTAALGVATALLICVFSTGCTTTGRCWTCASPEKLGCTWEYFNLHLALDFIPPPQLLLQAP